MSDRVSLSNQRKTERRGCARDETDWLSIRLLEFGRLHNSRENACGRAKKAELHLLANLARDLNSSPRTIGKSLSSQEHSRPRSKPII